MKETYYKQLTDGEILIDLKKVAEDYGRNLSELPYSIRVLLENIVRKTDSEHLDSEIKRILNWEEHIGEEINFFPARVVLQDYTGVPCVVDLASMRDAAEQIGIDAKVINPEIPVDLVIDHSVQVDKAGVPAALAYNMKKEFERNTERYRMLKWAQQSFDNFTVVPPDTGIIHQVNMEYLSSIVTSSEKDGKTYLYPDSVFGTDSHTTMINSLGILGWGVGGIEAEACMLGEASTFSIPEVIGVELINELPAGTVATDLSLTVAHVLRNENVVGKFVEFFGEGFENLDVAARATIANMSPEHGSTCCFFPVDEKVLGYMRLTGRSEEKIHQIEQAAKTNGLFYKADEVPEFTKIVTIDLSKIGSNLSGPKRPQDVVDLAGVSKAFESTITTELGNHGFGLTEKELDLEIEFEMDGRKNVIKTGDILIAAITSCTNTSNPSVLIGAGLLAKKAVEAGLTMPDKVKTSFAPGSPAVTSYLVESGLMEYLEKLGFHIVGYGCTTCIGNSGPLHPEIDRVLAENDMIGVNILSGNRNFESRIHPQVKASYLASPILVVAYALAGNLRVNITKEPVGYNSDGEPVYLDAIWPSTDEIQEYVNQFVTSEVFTSSYSRIFDGKAEWNAIHTTPSETYDWEEDSTYIANPPYFDDVVQGVNNLPAFKDMRVLAKLGDSVTTDHISPAGNIRADSAAGEFLIAHGIQPKNFNSYGARRGHHDVMVRGTLSNTSLRNQLVPGTTGSFTKHLSTGEVTSIFNASQQYIEEGTELVILAGKDYGMGSSRDWAAKGVQLLGVKAVIAESYERIHRSNLAMMGIIPLSYADGESADSLGLEGTENFTINLPDNLVPEQLIAVQAEKLNGEIISFSTKLQLISQVEVSYFYDGGILPSILKKKKVEQEARIL